MKYLDYPELELLSRALTFESSECKVFTRLEAYSCKAVTKEKRLFKNLESAYLRSASMSPPEHLDETLASPFGRLDQPSARKTLFLLIATLNGAFPDHDFSEVNPADFKKETSPAMVLNSLSTTLYSLRSGSNAPRSYSSLPSSYDQRISSHGGGIRDGGDLRFASGLDASNGLGASSFAGPNSYGISPSSIASHPALAAILDDIMCVSDCEVFTFHPDVDSDPHATADLDEEGLPDEETYDDAYWSDDGDAQMTPVQDLAGDGSGTPRQDRFGRDQDSYDNTDTPMFDEDFEGGFNPSSSISSRNNHPHASSSEASSEPRTPTTPTSASKSYFSSKEHHGSPSKSGQSFGFENGIKMNAQTFSQGEVFENEDYDYENEEELDGTGAGLLWATYAFFYNRKLKRILFVSVWSRKNSRDSYNSYNSTSNTSTTTSHQIPISSSTSFGNRSSSDSRSRSIGDSSRPSNITRVLNSNESNSKPSPAKRAIARTNSSRSIGNSGGKGKNRRNRTPSGSPAPSSLSPFPHASPRNSVPNSFRQGNSSLIQSTTSTSNPSSLSGVAIQSFSAPNSSSSSNHSSMINQNQSQNQNQNQIQDDSVMKNLATSTSPPTTSSTINTQQNKRPSSSLESSLAESKKART